MISNSNFKIQGLICKGKYGNILKVQQVNLNNPPSLAMKTMDKQSVYEHFHVGLVHHEKCVLTELDHPYANIHLLLLIYKIYLFIYYQN